MLGRCQLYYLEATEEGEKKMSKELNYFTTYRTLGQLSSGQKEYSTRIYVGIAIAVNFSHFWNIKAISF